MQRKHFLSSSLVILGFMAVAAKWPFGGKNLTCRDKGKPEGDKSPRKFLSAFTSKKMKGLPTNPVSY